ncbi:hypothetical protein LRR81_08040 [Metabacillus sp. GX 13764]|uniref:hypothetical protein n=1 Tax=Metabacillus kandeliae TaxID=2900151 RepID=UPI001E45EF9E|nr:hypothetical protein [Metabacillus kandeliae]MCD7034181.1 hypothetical protein [Metabacillus kandeliae]
MKEIAELTKMIILFVLIVQCTYAFCLFLLGNILFRQFENGMIKQPKNGLFKAWNAALFLLFGIGPFFYSKLLHHNWIVRRLFLLMIIFLMVAAAEIFYLVMGSFIRVFLS